MVGLLDIADLSDTVEVRGKKIEVRGITAMHFVFLFRRYPELRKLMTGHGDANVIDSLINQAPMAVADIIALVTGGDKVDTETFAKMSEIASNLPVGDQYAILEKVGTLSFPQGVKSFLDRVGAALGVPPGALGWDRVTKSQAPSPSASASDAASETAGTAPPAS